MLGLTVWLCGCPAYPSAPAPMGVRISDTRFRPLILPAPFRRFLAPFGRPLCINGCSPFVIGIMGAVRGWAIGGLSNSTWMTVVQTPTGLRNLSTRTASSGLPFDLSPTARRSPNAFGRPLGRGTGFPAKYAQAQRTIHSRARSRNGAPRSSSSVESPSWSHARELLSLVDYLETDWASVPAVRAAAKVFLWSCCRKSEVAGLTWDALRIIGDAERPLKSTSRLSASGASNGGFDCPRRSTAT